MDFQNPGAMDGFELTIPGTGYPLPEGFLRRMSSFLII
jgi:hypothetical protein